MTIQQACEKFLAEAGARNLRKPTLYKYGLLFQRGQPFAKGKGLRYVEGFNLDRLREFRETWSNRNLSALKKLECLRAFFRFAYDSGWIPDHPARKIRNPKIEERPTLPFTQEEVRRILLLLVW